MDIGMQQSPNQTSRTGKSKKGILYSSISNMKHVVQYTTINISFYPGGPYFDGFGFIN